MSQVQKRVVDGDTLKLVLIRQYLFSNYFLKLPYSSVEKLKTSWPYTGKITGPPPGGSGALPS